MGIPAPGLLPPLPIPTAQIIQTRAVRRCRRHTLAALLHLPVPQTRVSAFRNCAPLSYLASIVVRFSLRPLQTAGLTQTGRFSLHSKTTQHLLRPHPTSISISKTEEACNFSGLMLVTMA